MTWDHFTRAVTFLLGVVILLVACIESPPRWGLIGLSLVLLGVITGDQLRYLMERRRAASEAAVRAVDSASRPETDSSDSTGQSGPIAP